MAERTYYNPDYERVCTEEEVRKYYQWLRENAGMKQSYKEFVANNFE